MGQQGLPSLLVLISTVPGLFSSLTLKKKTKKPNLQNLMVLYWIGNLNQPRAQRAPRDEPAGPWERDSSHPTPLWPFSPSHQHKQPHALPSTASDEALGVTRSSLQTVFHLGPVFCLYTCGSTG